MISRHKATPHFVSKEVKIRPPDPRVGTAPSLVMACGLKIVVVQVRFHREPVEGEVPGQRVCPFMAEHLNGLSLPHLIAEKNDEPLLSPKTLAQDCFLKPGRPNDDWEGRRA